MMPEHQTSTVSILLGYMDGAAQSSHTQRFTGADRDHIDRGWSLGKHMVLLERDAPEPHRSDSTMILGMKGGSGVHVLKQLAARETSGDSRRRFALPYFDNNIVLELRPKPEGGMEIAAINDPNGSRSAPTALTGAVLMDTDLGELTANWLLSGAEYTTPPDHAFNPIPKPTPENTTAIVLVPNDKDEDRHAILIRRSGQGLIEPEDILLLRYNVYGKKYWFPVPERYLKSTKSGYVIRISYTNKNANNMTFEIDSRTGKLRNANRFEKMEILALAGSGLQDFGLLK